MNIIWGILHVFGYILTFLAIALVVSIRQERKKKLFVEELE